MANELFYKAPGSASTKNGHPVAPAAAAARKVQSDLLPLTPSHLFPLISFLFPYLGEQERKNLRLTSKGVHKMTFQPMLLDRLAFFGRPMKVLMYRNDQPYEADFYLDCDPPSLGSQACDSCMASITPVRETAKKSDGEVIKRGVLDRFPPGSPIKVVINLEKAVFTFSFNEVWKEVAELLKNFEPISVELRGMEKIDLDPTVMPFLAKVQELDVSGCYWFWFDYAHHGTYYTELSIPRPFENLKKLSIDCDPIMSTAIEQQGGIFKLFPNLTSLRISEHKFPDSQPLQINQPSLEELVIEHNRGGPEHWNIRAHNLKKLKLSRPRTYNHIYYDSNCVVIHLETPLLEKLDVDGYENPPKLEGRFDWPNMKFMKICQAWADDVLEFSVPNIEMASIVLPCAPSEVRMHGGDVVCDFRRFAFHGGDKLKKLALFNYNRVAEVQVNDKIFNPTELMEYEEEYLENCKCGRCSSGCRDNHYIMKPKPFSSETRHIDLVAECTAAFPALEAAKCWGDTSSCLYGVHFMPGTGFEEFD